MFMYVVNLHVNIERVNVFIPSVQCVALGES